MNLHSIASAAISAVNPMISVLYRKASGYTTDASGKRAPAYTDYPSTSIQLQALSAKDLEHVDALNITGLLRSVHMNGDAQAVDRANAKGGDLFVIANAVWLVVHVMESWPDWCRVVIAKQTDMAAPAGVTWDGGATWDNGTPWAPPAAAVGWDNGATWDTGALWATA